MKSVAKIALALVAPFIAVSSAFAQPNLCSEIKAGFICKDKYLKTVCDESDPRLRIALCQDVYLRSCTLESGEKILIQQECKFSRRQE